MKKVYLFTAALILLLTPLKAMGNEEVTNTNEPEKSVSSSDTIVIAADQILEENLLGAANVIDIKGHVNGDVIVAAAEINVDGVISGDLIAAAGKIEINGTVEGDVRVAAGSLTVNGKVGKNINALTGSLTTGEKSEVGGGLMFGADKVVVEGKIGQGILAGVRDISLNAEIGRKITLYNESPDASLQLGSKSMLKGGIKYISATELKRDPEAKVEGKVEKIAPPIKKNDTSFSTLLHILIKIFAACLLGLVFMYVFKKKVADYPETLQAHTLPAFGWGLLILFATPFVIILMMITVIGIPLGIITFFFWMLAIYLSKVVIGLSVGSIIFEKMTKDKKKIDWRFPLVTGIAITIILTSLPFIGGLVGFFVVTFGLGLMWMHFKNFIHEGKKEKGV